MTKENGIIFKLKRHDKKKSKSVSNRDKKNRYILAVNYLNRFRHQNGYYVVMSVFS